MQCYLPLKNENDKIMNRLSLFILLALLALGCQTGPGRMQTEKERGSATHEIRSSDVRVEWVSRNILKMAQSPLDVEISADGKWMFVLTRQGNIYVYSAEGDLKDVMVVGSYVDGIR